MPKPSVVTLILPACLLLIGMPFEDVGADQIDTLDLQYQWSCPLSVIDMRLVDFNQDGAAEILVGFNSDSARVGILDAAAQTLTWQSFGLPGEVLCVAAGDRNGDDHLDIAAGGWMPGEYHWDGYLRTFDGPEFDSSSTIGPVDHAVTAAGIFRLGLRTQRKSLPGPDGTMTMTLTIPYHGISTPRVIFLHMRDSNWSSRIASARGL